MKPTRTLSAALFLLLLLSIVSHAESPAAPAAADQPMNMPKGMGMHRGMGGMGQMSEEERDKHLHMEQDHMLKMHDLSNRILAEPDAKKKEQLKNEQFELMKAHRAQMMSHRMEIMQSHQKTEKPAAKPTK